jgi:hypothetical protein
MEHEFHFKNIKNSCSELRVTLLVHQLVDTIYFFTGHSESYDTCKYTVWVNFKASGFYRNLASDFLVILFRFVSAVDYLYKQNSFVDTYTEHFL